MGSCCGTQEGTQHELDNKTKTYDNTAKPGKAQSDEESQFQAALFIQAHFKGLIARRAVKAQYGFET